MPMAEQAGDDGAPRRTRAPRRSRRSTPAPSRDSGGARRLRHRPHARCCTRWPIASAAPAASTSTSSAPPARPSASSAPSRPTRRSSSGGARRRRRAPSTRATPSTARCAFFQRARAPDGRPATFLLDEVLELRTFESFPGLRHVLRELLAGARRQPQPLRAARAATSPARTALLRDAAARFEVMHLPPLSAADVAGDAAAAAARRRRRRSRRPRPQPSTRWPTAAPPTCARSARPPPAMRQRGGDPVSALTALLTADGALTAWCGYRYELRLHRARGYGALKAILEILAEEEPLTLTEISQRLQRTPGSTKDYLSWLEDVDLVVVAAEALQLRRPAAAPLGAAALPARAARRGRRRARGAGLRARAPAARPSRPPWPRVGTATGDAVGASSRSTESVELRAIYGVDARARPAQRRPDASSAAARRFLLRVLLRPARRPSASTSPSTTTSHARTACGGRARSRPTTR